MTRDVAPFSVVAGVPAREIERLESSGASQADQLHEDGSAFTGRRAAISRTVIE